MKISDNQSTSCKGRKFVKDIAKVAGEWRIAQKWWVHIVFSNANFRPLMQCLDKAQSLTTLWFYRWPINIMTCKLCKWTLSERAFQFTDFLFGPVYSTVMYLVCRKVLSLFEVTSCAVWFWLFNTNLCKDLGNGDLGTSQGSGAALNFSFEWNWVDGCGTETQTCSMITWL
jgi:hypothetical protein